MNGCVACEHGWVMPVMHNYDCPKWRPVSGCGEYEGPEDRCGAQAVLCSLDSLAGVCEEHTGAVHDPWGYKVRDAYTDWTPGELMEAFGKLNGNGSYWLCRVCWKYNADSRDTCGHCRRGKP